MIARFLTETNIKVSMKCDCWISAQKNVDWLKLNDSRRSFFLFPYFIHEVSPSFVKLWLKWRKCFLLSTSGRRTMALLYGVLMASWWWVSTIVCKRDACRWFQSRRVYDKLKISVQHGKSTNIFICNMNSDVKIIRLKFPLQWLLVNGILWVYHSCAKIKKKEKQQTRPIWFVEAR